MNKRRVLSVLGLVLMISLSQPLLGQKKNPASDSIKIPFETYKLPNGLTVILSEDHTTPTVAVNVWYHVGSKNEMPGRTEASYDFQAGTNRKIREAVEAALKHTILTVEVTGWWIWVSGTAKRGTSPANDAALDALQKAGYHWHSAKKLWYYAGIPSKNRREWSMDEIRNTYGSKVREGQSESNQSEPEPVKAQRIA